VVDTDAPVTDAVEEDRPALSSARLYLKEIGRAEALTILSGREPGIRFGPGYPNPGTLEVMQRVAAATDGTHAVNFIIARRSDNAAIGGIGYWFPEGPDLPRVGYDIVEPLWGHGYATEALRLLLDQLLSRPDIKAVRGDASVDNVASHRVMEKAGLSFVERFREEGEETERLLFEIRKP
jgi:RimJ/RimL family protein N-acetyltransferase